MISSDYLFHFTDTLTALKSILKEGIWVKRCIEDISFLKETNLIDIEAVFGENFNTHSNSKTEEKTYKLSIPMACFCDIPLHLTKEHRMVYGNYALGLNKNWGIQIGINPVCYLSPKSDLSSAIRKLNSLTQRYEYEDPNYQVTNSFYKVISFLKLYEGFYKKGKYTDDNHRFYDEREWRYILKGDKIKIAPPKHFDKNETKKIYTKLKFLSSDLKYIIVENDIEKNEVRKFLENIKMKDKQIIIKSFQEISKV